MRGGTYIRRQPAKGPLPDSLALSLSGLGSVPSDAVKQGLPYLRSVAVIFQFLFWPLATSAGPSCPSGEVDLLVGTNGFGAPSVGVREAQPLNTATKFRSLRRSNRKPAF